MSTFPYWRLDRSLQATGEFYISGERLGSVFSPKRRFCQICVDFIQEFLRWIGVFMKLRLNQVRIVGPLARIHARQPAAIASIEGIWSSSPSASAVVALLCIEHPTTTSRIAMLAAVCRREAFLCFMPRHSAPQVAGWMIHILSALVRIAMQIEGSDGNGRAIAVRLCILAIISLTCAFSSSVGVRQTLQVAICFHDRNFLILQPPRAIANALRVSMDDHDAALRCSYAHLPAIGPGADLLHASRKRSRSGCQQHEIVRE
jgi:hypothetical protein